MDGLDLQVDEGEILGLLGPNGAGKTTTIRVLSTLSGFDEGEVIVAGHNVDVAPEKVRKAIGVVAQNTGIDYFLTGRENLQLQGQLYRMPKADIAARIEELAGYFELGDSLDRDVAGYSGGMRRKLDIATALIHRPKLVFLDEPTLGLDIKSRKILWRYIEKLNREMGLTILLTTHYLEEADKLAHRVAIISAGKIRALGTPDELKGAIAGDAVSITFEEQGGAAQSLAAALQRSDFIKDALWEGNKLHLYVADGAESVPRITAMAAEQGARIMTLSLSRPSLDDVFLKYTGSSIDDSAEDSGEQWWQQWAGKGGGGKWAKQWQQEEGEAGAAGGGEAEPPSWPKDRGGWSGGGEQDNSAASPEARGDAAPQQEDWQNRSRDQGGDKDDKDKESGESGGTAGSGEQSGGWGGWSAEDAERWRAGQGGADKDKH